MTSQIRAGFRRLLITGAAVPAVAALGVGLTAASASASATAPRYGHQRCDETLTYIQEGYYGGGQFVFVRDVCNVQVFFQGNRHHRGEEDVTWQTESRRGGLRDHFAEDVRDVRVF
jgi:hypothetical protein